MASADYVCFLDHDDTLAPTALQDSLDKLSEGFDAVYSDEDKIDLSGLDYVESFFKPDWSPEYFRGVMYAGHLLCVRRELALAVGGFKSEYDGVQDYEFLLRISEVTNKIGHISKMLYHWRKIRGSIAGDINAKAGIEPLQQAAVNSHLQRLGLPAKAEPGVGGHRVNINPLPRNQNPLVSIIIAVKDAYVPREDCLKNIISQSTYPNFEVLVVESETADTPKSLNGENQISVKSIKLQPPFTPARAYNLGSKSARGEYLVFLSDIAEIITEDWLRHLLYYAEQPDVGAVGSLLLSADRIVQHAGLVLGDKSTVNWVMKGFPSNSDGYAGSLVCAREVSAVTDSCMMVKKSEFEKMGGFSEHFFTYYQDIDYCLRLKKEGKRIILTPRSVLISHEPGRRQGYEDSVDRMLLLDRWEIDIEQGDSYYNPNFDSERNDYTIRA
jgi:GT2 family glycosyltransferase